MNTPRRLRFSAALFGAATLAASALTLLPGTARAQTAVTDPVGYLSIALPANSDTFVSIPFTRPAEFTGAVASVANLGTAPYASGTITLSGTPGFTAGAFAPLAATAPNDGHKTYYAIIGPKNAALTPTLSVTNASATVMASTTTPEAVAGDTITVAGYTFTIVSVSGATLTIDRVYPGTTASGLAATYDHSPSEGRFYDVTTNDAGSLMVNLNGDSLSNVTVGTQVSVIPHWTLGSVFPNGQGVNPSAGFTRATEVLLPDTTSAGTNLAPRLTYFFSNAAQTWQLVGQSGNQNDTILYPDNYFIVRHNTSNPTTLTTIGAVLTKRAFMGLATNNTKKQDNFIAIVRPVPVSLNDSGLIGSGAFAASAGFTRTDELLVLDNVTIGKNKAAPVTYYYSNGGWRRIGTPIQGTAGSASDPGTDTVFVPGSGVIIRKNINASAGTIPTVTSFWTNVPTY